MTLVLKRTLTAVAIATLSALSALSAPEVMASDLTVMARGGNGGGKGGGPGGDEPTPPAFYSWMHSEVQDGWDMGALGQGATITIVDDFSSQWGYFGDLDQDGTQELLRHGEWTALQASMIAPSARIKEDDFAGGGRVRLAKGFNVLNLSYGMMAEAGYSRILWGGQESSIISHAQNGNAVIAKSAGNDAVAIGATNSDGLVDYLARDLIGAQSALFVGALERNGSTSNPASLAYYSNYAGSDTVVQDQFLVVGVDRDAMGGLAGTSFAAPIVAGYSAMLHSKFESSSPTAVANRLLDTARTDTISGYSESIHGQGEASILNALGPDFIY